MQPHLTQQSLFAGFKTVGRFDNITILGGDVTPERAEAWLATSPLNRNTAPKLVTAYAESMKRGEWPITNTGPAFDTHNRFIDGHHRMEAIIKYGKPVSMLVFVGLTAEAWDKIDNGRPRTLGDRLKMFRPNMQNHNAWAGYVSLCAQLLSGQSVLVKTLEDFDRWSKLFYDGVAWSLDCFKGSPDYRNASVAGSLAFAFATDPKRVDAFGQALAKTEFKAKTPVWACDRFLRNNDKIDASRAGGTGRIVTIRKVLNYVHADFIGQKLTHALDTDDGVRYFRAAYDTKNAKNLTRPWHVENVKEPSKTAAAAA